MKEQYTKQEKEKYLQESLKEFETTFPMTPSERKELRKWVKGGNDIYENPGCYSSENGSPMNYVEAMRFENAICEERRLNSN